MADRSTGEGKETISYDEYINSEIPDTLLEGLGFYKSATNTESETTVEENSMDAATDNNTECSSARKDTSVVLDETDLKKPIPRQRDMRMPRIVLRPPVAEVSPVVPAGTSLVRSPQPKSLPANHQQIPPTHRIGRTASKVVVKGNIMYERTETGEVIASVIKSGGVPPVMTAPTSNTSTFQRGRPPATSENRLCTSSGMTGEYSVPLDCPINENTVESVLDESISATQAMRRTLTSLKDDLRRMGGGPTVTPALKPIHIQHRIEVACKLACAFVEYRELISKINNDSKMQEAGSVTPVPRSANNENFNAPLLQGSRSVDVASVIPSTESANKRKYESTSKRKHDSAIQSSKKRTVIAQAESVVSDDLWMSCEPCD